jgi:RNA polymerase sigma factor (sigma-70 family)
MSTETTAYTAMYRAHYPDVLRFVRRRAHPSAVDDIVAETFLVAWRRRLELPADPRPWLFRTARNAVFNAHRGAGRQAALAVRIADAHPGDGYDPISPVENRLEWVAAWRRLTPADQEVLALHVWEELDGRAAATVLGCTRAGYSMRLSRARKRLEAALTEQDANPTAVRRAPMTEMS